VTTRSTIEWTEQSWNPCTGCTKVSPGCQNCFAERMALRLKAMGMKAYANGFTLTVHPDRLNAPLLRRKPTVYFVNSMSDVFHKAVPDEFIDRIFAVMTQTPRHIYQLLTKRADRMARFLSSREVPHNVWIGVTVENRDHGLPRMATLKTIDAPVRFLCMEPLLEDLGDLDLAGIHWVIVGGESGPRARPMRPAWVQSIKDQCDLGQVPFFFKQWGVWGPDGRRRSRKANGRRLLGRTWDDMPACGPGEPRTGEAIQIRNAAHVKGSQGGLTAATKQRSARPWGSLPKGCNKMRSYRSATAPGRRIMCMERQQGHTAPPA